LAAIHGRLVRLLIRTIRAPLYRLCSPWKRGLYARLGAARGLFKRRGGDMQATCAVGMRALRKWQRKAWHRRRHDPLLAIQMASLIHVGRLGSACGGEWHLASDRV